MSDITRADLRHLLVTRYAELTRRLARDVGSGDLAEEALQDTWLRLHQDGPMGPIRNARAYLLRVALNIARDRLRADKRRAAEPLVDEALFLIDDAPDPEAAAQGRSEMRALREALKAMPERRRRIFEAAWGEGLPHTEIAERFGLTVRSINLELAQAREACALHIKRNALADFRKAGSDSSHD